MNEVRSKGRFGIWLFYLIQSVLVVACPSDNLAVFHIACGDVAGLINAINTANSNGQDNTINLAACIYTLTAVDNDTFGPNGLPSITGKMTIKGAGANTTIIERDASAPNFRIIHVAATGSLTLDGLTMKGGIAPQNTEHDEEETGGGILNDGGKLNINDSNISSNIEVRGMGGGISNLNGGTVTITKSTVSNNEAALSSCSGVLNAGPMSITNSFISDNFAEGFGGICNGSEMTINHSTISGNGSDAGPGIENDGTMTISNSIISNHSHLLGGTGGIENDGTMTIINSTIANNRGALISGSITGGGISNFRVVSIINSTIVNNSGGEGAVGGIFNDAEGTVELQNTILSLNTEEVGEQLKSSDCSGKVTSLGNNIIGDTTGCTITLQSSDLTGDPGLGLFTDNGTPGNGHFPLLSNSRAIDAGNNAVCLGNSILATDQIGDPRVGICDIGSIEFEPFNNLGDCISTLIQQNCSGLQGQSLAACIKEQQTFCSNLFNSK